MDLPVSSATLATSKSCQKCDGVHPIVDFSVDRSKQDGRSIYCRSCRSKIAKNKRSLESHKENQRKTAHRRKPYNRNWTLKARYGITSDQFETMFATQGSVCALCKSDKSDKKNFVVDHCHKTGKVRGILCSYCNRALGMMKDDPEVLRKAIKYLEE